MHVLSSLARPARLNRSAAVHVVSHVSRAEGLTGRISVSDIALRVLGAVALAISSYVHLHLAHIYTSLGDTITQGDLFYAEGAAAAAVALWVLVTGGRWAWVAVGLVAAASFGAVMLYRYVDVGSIGPIPNMYEPSWLPSPDKGLSAIAEAVGVVTAAAALLRIRARR